MPARWPWFERPFAFDFPAEKLPEIVERLRGTPLRARHLVRGLPGDVLAAREGETWSINRNVGHLADLEPLWLGRLDDLLAGADVMREADLTNRATHEADHDEQEMATLLSRFADLRATFVERLETLDESACAATSLHPRLRMPMRVVDLGAFVADHDDYHLARITELSRMLAKGEAR